MLVEKTVALFKTVTILQKRHIHTTDAPNTHALKTPSTNMIHCVQSTALTVGVFW